LVWHPEDGVTTVAARSVGTSGLNDDRVVIGKFGMMAYKEVQYEAQIVD
jgi:hypothetical protein